MFVLIKFCAFNFRGLPCHENILTWKFNAQKQFNTKISQFTVYSYVVMYTCKSKITRQFQLYWTWKDSLLPRTLVFMLKWSKRLQTTGYCPVHTVHPCLIYQKCTVWKYKWQKPQCLWQCYTPNDSYTTSYAFLKSSNCTATYKWQSRTFHLQIVVSLWMQWLCTLRGEGTGIKYMIQCLFLIASPADSTWQK